jgi:4-amino-4-deoxy-L-arabinose transferase-like glycosyltransferase
MSQKLTHMRRTSRRGWFKLKGEWKMNMNNTSGTNNVGVWLALGAGIGAALMSAGLGAAGVAVGVAAGLMLWAIQQWRSSRAGKK